MCGIQLNIPSDLFRWTLTIIVLMMMSVSVAETKFGSTIYPKLCYFMPKFCYQYAIGGYGYPYQIYPYGQIALPQINGAFPYPIGQIQVNPTGSASYTIPTVYTTTSRPASPGLQFPNGLIPSGGSTICPPLPIVCPPGINAPIVPNIDPRQGLLRMFNGCACIDQRDGAGFSQQIPQAGIGSGFPQQFPPGAIPVPAIPSPNVNVIPGSIPNPSQQLGPIGMPNLPRPFASQYQLPVSPFARIRTMAFPKEAAVSSKPE